MQDHYSETHQTWNKLAQPYEDKFMALELYNDTYQEFCDFLERDDAAVLELGCGPGNITRHLLDLKPELNMLASDISQNMLELAARNNPGIETQLLDCRNLKEVDKTFEGIVCGFTIPYLSKEHCAELIHNCSNLLTSKGIFYLSFVPGDYQESGFISGSTGDRTYFYYHEETRILNELKLNNLEVKATFKKAYNKSPEESETHLIIITQKLPGEL